MIAIPLPLPKDIKNIPFLLKHFEENSTIGLSEEQEFYDLFKSNYQNSKIKNAKCRLNVSDGTCNAFVCVYSLSNKSKIKALIHRADVAKRSKEKLQHDHCDRLTVESIHFFNESYKCKFLHHFKQVKAIAQTHEIVTVNYVMVMNTYNRLTGNIDFDIPGGKRRLGESSFDCAIRETEEETSLALTRDILNNATVTVYPGKT